MPKLPIAFAPMLLIAALCPLVLAQQEPARADTQSSAHRPSASDVLLQKAIPAMSISEGMSVDDFLSFLQDTVPGFQAVRDPGPWQRFSLPDLRLKNATLGQVLQLLEKLYPGLEVSQLSSDGGGSPVFLFRMPQVTASNPRMVRLAVLPLSNVVDHLLARQATTTRPSADNRGSPAHNADPAAVRKEATQRVLSLLEEAAKQSAAPAAGPIVSFHEETEIVLVRGTSDQIRAVQDAIDALMQSGIPNTPQHQPRASEETGGSEAGSEIERLRAALRDAQMRLDAVQLQLRDSQNSNLRSRRPAASPERQ